MKLIWQFNVQTYIILFFNNFFALKNKNAKFVGETE